MHLLQRDFPHARVTTMRVVFPRDERVQFLTMTKTRWKRKEKWGYAGLSGCPGRSRVSLLRSKLSITLAKLALTKTNGTTLAIRDELTFSDLANVFPVRPSWPYTTIIDGSMTVREDGIPIKWVLNHNVSLPSTATPVSSFLQHVLTLIPLLLLKLAKVVLVTRADMLEELNSCEERRRTYMRVFITRFMTSIYTHTHISRWTSISLTVASLSLSSFLYTYTVSRTLLNKFIYYIYIYSNMYNLRYIYIFRTVTIK